MTDSPSIQPAATPEQRAVSALNIVAQNLPILSQCIEAGIDPASFLAGVFAKAGQTPAQQGELAPIIAGVVGILKGAPS